MHTGTITAVPVGAAPVLPEADGHSAVIYRNAWPNVDLRYTVFSDMVKEDIVVRAPQSRTDFSFNDRGGNVARTWDRNATSGRTVTDAWDSASAPPSTTYTEVLRGPFANAPAGATAYAAPWRHVRSTRDALGNLTTTTVDPNGNPTAATPPRGNAAGTSDYTTTMTYDAGDNLVTRTTPLESTPTPKPWRWTYDGVGNRTTEKNAKGAVRTWRYDAVGRVIQERWSRTSDATQAPAACPLAPSTDSLFAGKFVCSSTVAYDGVDNARAIQDGNGITATITYDAVHRAVVRSQPRTVDASGAVTVAHRTVFRYDADGNQTDACSPRLSTEGDGTCNATSLYSRHSEFDVAGRPVRTTTYRQAGQALVTTTTYDADGNVVSTLDPNGNASVPADTGRRLTRAYDLLGRMVSESVPRAAGSSNSTTWNYDAVGNVTAVVRPGVGAVSRVTAYSYDAVNRAVDTVMAADSVVAALAGLPTADGGSNIRTRLVYDADGNVVARYGARAFASYTNAAGTAVADPRQEPNPAFMSRTEFDRNGRPVAEFAPRYDSGSASTFGPSTTQTRQCPSAAPYPASVGVCVTRTSYDEVGNRTQVVLPTSVDSANRRIDFEYTDDNLPAVVHAPSPQTEGARVVAGRRTYDGVGRVVQQRDALGHATTTEYSADGLLLVVSGQAGVNGSGQPLSHVARYGHDANGNIVSFTNPAGHVSTASYFADDRRSAYVDGKGNRTQYVYDANGNPTRVYSPAAVHADAQNDNNGAGVPTAYTYTYDNLLATAVTPVAPNGSTRRRVTYGYDSAGRKTSQQAQRVLVTPASAHDPATATVTVTGDDGAQTFTYYPNDLPKSESGRPVGGSVSATGAITYAYDAAGNLTNVSDSTSSSQPIVSTYYLDNLLRSVSDGTRDTRYSYDGAGNRVGLMDTFAGATAGTQYVYGDAGLPRFAASSRTGPTSDPTATPRWTWEYDLVGRPTLETDPAGRSTTSVWNTDDTLARHRVTRGGTTIADWTYTYDELYRIRTQTLPAGSPGALGGTAGSVGTYTYSYDAAGRLDGFTDPLGHRTITYDRNGNRVEHGRSTDTYTGTPKVRRFAYNADDSISEEQHDGGAVRTYAWSAAGNLEHDGKNCFGYDGFDRTVSVATFSAVTGCSPTATATYEYDGLDRQRRRVEVGTRSTDVHYDGLSSTAYVERVTASALPSVTTTGAYVLGPDGSPKAFVESTRTQYLADDGHGNVTTLTDASGAVTCTARFDPFGEPLGITAGDPNKVCNSGTTESTVFYRQARRDSTTGAYQFGARQYDPGKASFTTPDSYRTEAPGRDLALGVDPLTRNSYSYVNGDPVNLVDPDGHRACFDICGGEADSKMLARQRAHEIEARVRRDRIEGTVRAWFAKEAVRRYMGFGSSAEYTKYGEYMRVCPVDRGACIAAGALTVGASIAESEKARQHACHTDSFANCAIGNAVRDPGAEFVLIDLPASMLAPAVLARVAGVSKAAAAGVGRASSTAAAVERATLAQGAAGTESAAAAATAANTTRLAARAHAVIDDAAANTARAAVGAADDVPLHSPNFVVHSNGEIVAVPTGAVGPTPVRTGSGFQFRGGSGGHGLDPRVTDVRIMDPVMGGKHPLPNGYVSYGNASGQTVNPWTGRTIDPSNPWWHWGWSSP